MKLPVGTASWRPFGQASHNLQNLSLTPDCLEVLQRLEVEKVEGNYSLMWPVVGTFHIMSWSLVGMFHAVSTGRRYWDLALVGAALKVIPVVLDRLFISFKDFRKFFIRKRPQEWRPRRRQLKLSKPPLTFARLTSLAHRVHGICFGLLHPNPDCIANGTGPRKSYPN
jgi:hypothetical protein